jgi:hypothetical protein
MKNFYSASKRGFYNLDVHGSQMPDDVVSVTDEEYEYLISGQHEKEIVPDENGRPILVDVPPRVLSWVEKRQRSYPPISEQLDLIFHKGIEVWKEKIQEVKDSIPKEQ